ncbi:hypothetical protein GCM10011386_47790 [Parapedobacter defluvii]|uniref:6-bladed beta-propeller protein n=2 Tax=Parapedobacter defluvii TaxID=2045106 RepID=A0ABQ1MZC7_9SPHI|nr:hypothetical protein GCM10011386_47790 [Parapedobacter defluvii]
MEYIALKHKLMKEVFIIVLIGLIFMLESCGEKEKNIGDDVLVLDFRHDGNIDPNEILTTDYIKLETNDACLIDKVIVQVEYASDKIFILSGGADRNLLVFDISGNFINSIGNMGNGPGEYVMPVSFSIDTESNVVSVVDIAQRKIIEYGLGGFDFISEKELGYYSSCFEYINANQLLLKNSDSQSAYKDWEFLLTGGNLELEDKYVTREFVTGYSTGHTKNIYKSEGQVYAYAQYNPIIYRFQNDRIEPVYHIQFGKFNLPPKEYLEAISTNNANFLAELDVSDYIYYYCVFQTSNLLNVYYSVAQEAYIGLYNRNNDQIYSFPKTYFEEQMMVGYMDRPAGTINDFIVAALQPFDLKERLEDSYNFDPKLKTLIQNSEDDDNPILFLYKFKD